MSTKTWKTHLKKHDDIHLIDYLPDPISFRWRQGPLIYGFFLTKYLKTGIISIIQAAKSAFSDFVPERLFSQTFATLVKINTPIVGQMLIPKVTIRQMLFGMTILGIYSMILSWASQGSVIGYSLSLSIALLILPFAAYCGVYWVLYGMSNLGHRYWSWRTKRLSNTAQPGNERP